MRLRIVFKATEILRLLSSLAIRKAQIDLPLCLPYITAIIGCHSIMT
jgi:hypothetical protein